MRVVCISDTHTLHEGIQLPPGDLLIHAGDLTSRGALTDVQAFATWFADQPHRHKVLIAGNHDFCFQRAPTQAEPLVAGFHYLRDHGVEIEGLRIWGSPWQPWFHDWAFNLPRGEPLRKVWAKIPAGTDVLVTHGPPARHCDLTATGEHAGCEDLLARIQAIRPRLHVFGHIHEAHGVLRDEHTTFVNASICNLAYEPVQPPIVIDIE